METNNKTKVYEVYLYKDNSIVISEFDGDIYCVSDTIKRKAQMFADFDGNIGLTAVGDTKEEALTAIRSKLERDINKASDDIKKWNLSICAINNKLTEIIIRK